MTPNISWFVVCILVVLEELISTEQVEGATEVVDKEQVVVVVAIGRVGEIEEEGDTVEEGSLEETEEEEDPIIVFEFDKHRRDSAKEGILSSSNRAALSSAGSMIFSGTLPCIKKPMICCAYSSASV